ncbi:MAG TPA: substrate-binding domain-containing protein [Bryobacteraceae bacterium]|jgi:ribose transport system substrate-binding protein|nr:substrate-binding domain-containing protein [Bryobacteraceae bacterium]
MKVRTLLIFLTLPAALLPVLSCSSPAHAVDEHYYLVATNTKLPYWQAAKDGFLKIAGQYRVKAEMVGPDTYDANEELSEFQRVAKLEKTSGILISAADASIMKGAIDRAIDAGIPVITMDSDVPTSKRLMFIGTNNYSAGQLGGRELVKRTNGKGNFVVFTMPGQLNLSERLKGYEDALADHAGMKIVDTVDIKGDPRVAFDTASDLMAKKRKDIDGFICLEASAGQEVADVLNRDNITDKIVMAMDTNDDTLKWVKKGTIAATIAQKPFTMAYFGLQMLDLVHHHKPQNLDHDWAQDAFSIYPTFVDTGATLVTSSNVDNFQQARQESKQ